MDRGYPVLLWPKGALTLADRDQADVGKASDQFGCWADVDAAVERRHYRCVRLPRKVEAVPLDVRRDDVEVVGTPRNLIGNARHDARGVFGGASVPQRF